MKTSRRPAPPPARARAALALAAGMLATTGCSGLWRGDPAAGEAPAPRAIGVHYPAGFSDAPVRLERGGRPSIAPPRLALGGATRRDLARLLEAHDIPVVALRAVTPPVLERSALATIVEPRIRRMSLREPEPWRGFSGGGLHRAEVHYEFTVHREGEPVEVLTFRGRAERRLSPTLSAHAPRQRVRLARVAMRDALAQLARHLSRTEVARHDAPVVPAGGPGAARG